ncbi:UDP-N-acetylmuramoyl-tripeptide--D-alanyl-D-alanine ligase [Flavobacterium sp. JP2137]|uniref:UDP-N-acetylmuramoyl-tripeptide--D-alanyl-D- alanine ligase n=1 Tax=Flavobacterium sp. JP2137 TaxID=3414510 RepID=UPI003D2FA33A
MTIEELYQCFLQCDGVSIDTRNITPNSLFFALKGDNFDANTLAQQALDNGASFVVMDNKKLQSNPDKMFWYADALMALQELAKYHRQQLGLPIIALTGSNGKTTTKELILTVLSQKYQVRGTQGNLNNHIGVPLTLLSFDEDTDIGVVEMGANHLGEISHLCELTDPDFGYITNFGKAHLEGFGSFEGVVKAKGELYDYLENNYKLAFANTDDALQDAKTMTFARYTFGTDEQSDLIIQKYDAQPMASITVDNNVFQSQLTGIYNATNIAAAVAIGNYFKVPLEACRTAISQYLPTNNRSQWIEKNERKILLDAYNANPSSMEAALDNFLQLETQHAKTLFLGDMFELGTESSAEHLAVINRLKNTEKLTTFYIGKHFFEHKTTAQNTFFFEDYDTFAQAFKANPPLEKGLVLIKGSRGMALERILELL